jgi:alpha-beta hydrolase superfamily lysophospholipase
LEKISYLLYLRPVNKTLFLRWLKLFVVVYCLLGIAFYYLQERLLFHPQAVGADSVYRFTAPFKEINLPVDARTNINIIRFTVPDSIRKGLVLYFHGNRENVSHYAGFAVNFTRNGYEVWMPDYPGFGKSTGALSEQVLYEEALQVYKLARSVCQPSQLIIYGKSVGTGIAAQLASVRDCKRLILETPYNSITSLTKRYFWMYPVDLLLKYKLPTDQYLTKVTAPITVFHGTDDGLIALGNADQLKQQLKPADQFIVIPGGEHNNLNDFLQMQQKLDSLLQQ